MPVSSLFPFIILHRRRVLMPDPIMQDGKRITSFGSEKLQSKLIKKDGGKGTATTGNNNNSAASSNGGRPGKKNSGGDGFGGIAAAQAEEEIDEGKGFEPSVSSPQRMLECRPADTPMVVNHQLHMEQDAKLADKEKYQRLVGKLIYLSHTRPDIAYAVGVVSQFMHQPQVSHMEAVWRIIRYLKGTAGHGILFKTNGHLEIQGYTDADWAGSKDNRRSTAGYFTMVGGNLVTWRSKKQKVVALSSAEAEFRGIARGMAEVLWLKKLLTEIGFPPDKAIKVMCDNKAAIQISENPVQHDRTKHVEVDRHFIKEKIEAGIVVLPFVPSEDQVADILTKAVNKNAFNNCLIQLSFGNPTTQPSNIPVLKEVETILDPLVFGRVRFTGTDIPLFPFAWRTWGDGQTLNSGIELGLWASLGYLMPSVHLL
ncbi:hypothetical protein E3N88_37582 [Mikania micrantha]|uniref:Reverse transcriptase Ty1/copia-type domain-containing protein n=1 Tax=Mikania micrantha TaxID=192012 RepID=A0A5N6LSI7_9ASTR|nr:hypothetical protein E3N88_37582 [Mikania micrantha]